MESLRTMNISLSTAFIVFNKFGEGVPSFSLNSGKSLISFFISSLIIWYHGVLIGRYILQQWPLRELGTRNFVFEPQFTTQCETMFIKELKK